MTAWPEPTSTLIRRASWLFSTWAPVVLACGGQYEREKAALEREGVGRARLAYDDILAELARREAEGQERARLEHHLATEYLDAALAGSPFFTVAGG